MAVPVQHPKPHFLSDAGGSQAILREDGTEGGLGRGQATRPAISVVIPTRNRSGMVADCMRGLARQTIGLENFEVILIDNCSTEDLSPVVAEARHMGLKIRSARTREDRGPAPARNLGAELAQAPLIAFTDSDCRPTPEWLATMLPAFDDPKIGFVTGPVLAKPEQTMTFTSRRTFITPTEHPSFPTANLVMRRSAFEELGGFDASLSFVDPFARASECADTDLAWRVLKAGYRRAFLDTAVIEHEVEDESLWFWIISPSRVFVVPELVRRHPELRRELLSWGLFFYRPALLLYLAIPAAVALAWVNPLYLAALPAALLVRGVVRTGSLNPLVLARHSLRVVAHLPRMLVMIGALIYGSIRFRTLVL